MQHTLTERGDLVVAIDTPEDRTWVTETLERMRGDDLGFMAELLDYTGWQPNGVFEQVRPEEVGALTCAPMLAQDVVRDDEGTLTDAGRVYWYPGYETTHFGEVLLKQGRVVLTFAGEAEPKAA